MNIDEYKNVFVYAQQIDGKLSNVALELLGKGRDLANDLECELYAVVLGSEISDLPKILANYGADKVIIVDDPTLKVYMTEPYTYVLTEVLKAYKPDIFLIGASAIGRDLAPRLSARLKTGLTADCTKLEIDPEKHHLLATRPAFGGNIMATIICPEHRPQMATVRPGVMQKSPEKDRELVLIPFELPDIANHVNMEILEIMKKEESRIDIQEAKILVSGGRGISGAMDELDRLSGILHGTVAASRGAVDSGWIEKDYQVGQTGKTVRPNLYIACGISGAVQHVVGMEESDVIIAINKDASAPIFEICDFGVVGDVHDILPKLCESLEKSFS